MPAASPAILRADGLQRPTTAAIAKRGASGHQHGVHARIRRASPQQRNKPPDHCPTCQQIQNENSRGIALVMADDRRQKIQQCRNEKKRHVRTSESFDSDRTRGLSSTSYNEIRFNALWGSLDFSRAAPCTRQLSRPSRSGSRRGLRLRLYLFKQPCKFLL